jgi:hypothetical protein
MNPRVGSALQDTRAVVEEEAVEVVENHEGGTWRSRGRLFPKEGPREGVHREWTRRLSGRRRGDLWTIPGEAVQSGDRLDRRRWQVPGQEAPKVRRVAQTGVDALASGPGSGPRR